MQTTRASTLANPSCRLHRPPLLSARPRRPPHITPPPSSIVHHPPAAPPDAPVGLTPPPSQSDILLNVHDEPATAAPGPQAAEGDGLGFLGREYLSTSVLCAPFCKCTAGGCVCVLQSCSMPWCNLLPESSSCGDTANKGAFLCGPVYSLISLQVWSVVKHL